MSLKAFYYDLSKSIFEIFKEKNSKVPHIPDRCKKCKKCTISTSWFWTEEKWSDNFCFITGRKDRQREGSGSLRRCDGAVRDVDTNVLF